MPKIIRALLISAVATGVAAVVLKTLRPEAAPPPPTRQGAGPYIDADHLSCVALRTIHGSARPRSRAIPAHPQCSSSA